MRVRYDFLVVGGGIVGLATAIEVRKAFGGRVGVIDKEERLGAHASGRNSGVLHAGVYYRPGSLKARLCVEGNRLMRAYCQEKDVARVDGKVIVTRSARELPALFELERRATAGGARVEMVDEAGLREIEPYARTVERAIYSPDTAVVDPAEVLERLAEDARALGVGIMTGVRLDALDPARREAAAGGRKLAYGFLINAAGAYADRVAQMCGVGAEYTMLPYKGLYFRVGEQAAHLVRANVYPVPDIRFPFLGVHFTRTPGGVVKIGPTAIPAFSRENYGLFENIRLAELRDCVWCGGRKLVTDWNYARMAVRESAKYLRYVAYREARRLVPGLSYSMVARYPLVGIRPQVFDRRSGELVSDFVVLESTNAVHILNAVSPAFTSSLAFARHVVKRMG